MRRYASIAALAGICLAPSLARGASPELELRARAVSPSPPAVLTFEMSYAQSLDAWSTVQDVKAAQGNLAAVNDILNRKYGAFEETFGQVKAGLRGLRLSREPGLFESLYLQSRAEAAGMGLVQNPVVPELHAITLATGILEGGFEGEVRSMNATTHLGLAAGLGMEKRVDAFSTDLIEDLPTQTGTLSLLGLDLGIERVFRPTHAIRVETQARLRETLFFTTSPQNSLTGMNDQQLWAHRWSLQGSIWRPLPWNGLRNWDAGLDVIAGPQPIGQDLLPRTWDYIHQIKPFPELGTMLGSGVSLRSRWSKGSSLKGSLGYYGGYVGGNLTLRGQTMLVSASSFGLEGSNAFHALGQRVWLGSIGAAF